MKKLLNQYGNIDVRKGVPADYAHVKGDRLGPLCRKLNIEYATALVGFDSGRSKTRWKAKLDGVFVALSDQKRLEDAITERQAKRDKVSESESVVKNFERRLTRWQRDVEEFATQIARQFPGMSANERNQCAEHACEISSGRVGRTKTIDLYERVRRAVVAFARHRASRYELLLECGYDQREAREEVAAEIAEQIQIWQQINPAGGIDQESTT